MAGENNGLVMVGPLGGPLRIFRDGPALNGLVRFNGPEPCKFSRSWLGLFSVVWKTQQRASCGGFETLKGISTVSIEKQKVQISVAILQRGRSSGANL